MEDAVSDGRRDASGAGKPWGSPIISDQGQPVMGDAVSGFDDAIEHLKRWPKAYGMGTHDTSVVRDLLDGIDRLRAELAYAKEEARLAWSWTDWG
jgi:hypothetical protein